MKYLAFVAALLLALPAANAAKRNTKKRFASAQRAGVVYPIARAFVAVRSGSGGQSITIRNTPGKAARTVTVRVVRVSNGQEVQKKIGTLQGTSGITATLPSNTVGSFAGMQDAQTVDQLYAIQVTTGKETKAGLSNTDVQGNGIKLCRVNDNTKWFDAKDAGVMDSSGKGIYKRPETDPWPVPDPASSCRQ